MDILCCCAVEEKTVKEQTNAVCVLCPRKVSQYRTLGAHDYLTGKMLC